MNKLINVEHHLDDYECMWNGIEDLYMNASGDNYPPSFFFVLSSFGSFCYMKTPKTKIKRLVALGDGRTKKMYESLAPIIDLSNKFLEYDSFEKALTKVKKEIDNGYPCVIGALDMYYLSYLPKLYQHEHIPFHYVMVIGYDEDKEIIYLNDCGRKEVQTLSFTNLKLAWNCQYPGLSKPNTICAIRLNTLKDKYTIAKTALALKTESFLNPPVNFLGYKGFNKFISELPNWQNELTKQEYDDILFNMVQFFGTVPTIPNALKGLTEPDEITFYGSFDKVVVVLEEIGQAFNDESMLKAAIIFKKGCEVISNIKDIIVNYLTDKVNLTSELPALFKEVLNIMINGLTLLKIDK